ncbi:MAG: DUF1003 domain-containing protein [Alphaproteobacteria bacterium]|nr:DUF1003 domain-containing protein [Alphaproteobacteria bacterium]MCW5744069.1 DUF1003 domain-containing protein [Alphaproteobacteria bacterium]
MNEEPLRAIAQQLMRKRVEELDELEKRVLSHIARDAHISRYAFDDGDGGPTTGERIADRVASFGGSWTFIGLFMAVLLAWCALNAFALSKATAFDPYPFILLNLVLSMLAALQAPIIMMSQNRQAQKDRATARHDYEVNLKAELDIMALHDKLDELREMLAKR